MGQEAPPPGSVSWGRTCDAGINRCQSEAPSCSARPLAARMQFVRAGADERMQEEQRFIASIYRMLPQMPDLQCAWLLLALCVGPQANHAIGTAPPHVVAPYAAAHDAGIREPNPQAPLKLTERTAPHIEPHGLLPFPFCMHAARPSLLPAANSTPVYFFRKHYYNFLQRFGDYASSKFRHKQARVVKSHL